MNISDIKAAVDAARERQCKGVPEDELSIWNTRPAQQETDAALIALWEMMQPVQSDVPFRGMVAKPVENGWEVSLFESGGKVWEFELGSEQESTDATDN
jgi:hypothetical protein